jgi:hypothetical protein
MMRAGPVFDSAQTSARKRFSLCNCPSPSLRRRYRLPDPPTIETRRYIMLETIAIILVVLWLLGLVTSYTMGGLIHALLVIAIVVILIRVIQGRRV